jgi:hypothetical protein
MLPETLQFVIAMIACAINERMQRTLAYYETRARRPFVQAPDFVIRTVRGICETTLNSGR